MMLLNHKNDDHTIYWHVGTVSRMHAVAQVDGCLVSDKPFTFYIRVLQIFSVIAKIQSFCAKV